jgi:hypothetical protein
LISDFQAAIVSRLAAGRLIKGPPAVKVLSERQSDLNQQIQVILAKKVGNFGGGLALTVGTPKIGAGSGGSERMIRATALVTVSENVALNQGAQGTRIPAADMALYVYCRLLRFAPPGWSEFSGVAGGDPIQFVGAGEVPEKGIALMVQYGVSLTAMTRITYSEEVESGPEGQ